MKITDFSGAKLAVIAAGQVLAFQRDNLLEIPYPGLWEVPGGGRDDEETPVETAIRETWEEAGLQIHPSMIVWQRIYRNQVEGELPTWFMVAKPGWLALPAVRLGSEGQDVRWMPIDTFLDLPNAVGFIQDRLREYLSEAELGSRRLG